MKDIVIYDVEEENKEDYTIKDEGVSIEELLKADNIVELLSDDKLTEISQQVSEDYNLDKTSCAHKIKELKEVVEIAMIISKQKTYPWTGASNVIFPLIANACIDFAATCYPEIIKDGQVVKAKIVGKDEGVQMKDAEGIPMSIPTEGPDGQPSQDPEAGKPIMQNVGLKQKRGDRVATAMNWQLMEEQDWWERDVDKLVHALPCVGDMYKKVYYDPIKEMPVSELIFPDKLVINNGARDINSSVVTEIIELYPQEIMQRIRYEMFSDFDFNYESDKDDGDTKEQGLDSIQDESGVNNRLHTFLEQHTWLDLDDDGFPEPYIVTIHDSSSKVVRIVARYTKDSIKYNSRDQIKDIIAQKYYVHYPFIPSLDGSFFSLGFGHLLLNTNNAINTTLNQLIDAGHLSITGGGFISKGFGKSKAGKMALAPGEWKIVNVGSDDLRTGIVPIPHPQPSPVLFSLLGAMIDAGKSLGSLSDVLTGESAGNIQATTMVSMVEQGLKQFKSIYKRIYKSEKDEFKLLYGLNERNLTNEKYAEILDEPLLEVDVKSDFNRKNYDICPVADIDAVTNFQRMAMAQFYMSFLNDPYVDPIEVRKRIFGAANSEDIDKLVIMPKPQPDPALQIEQMRLEAKSQESQAKNNIETQKIFAEMEEMKSTIAKTNAEIAKIETDSMLNLANIAKVSKETDLKEEMEKIKVLDNQLDKQAKEIEVEGRRHDAELKHAVDVERLNLEKLKLAHNNEQNRLTREYKTPKQEPTTPQQSQVDEG